MKIEVLEPPGRIFRNALEKYPFIFVKLRSGSGQIFKLISVIFHFGGSRTRQTWDFGFFTTFPHFCGGSRPAKMDPPDYFFWIYMIFLGSFTLFKKSVLVDPSLVEPRRLQNSFCWILRILYWMYLRDPPSWRLLLLFQECYWYWLIIHNQPNTKREFVRVLVLCKCFCGVLLKLVDIGGSFYSLVDPIITWRVLADPWVYRSLFESYSMIFREYWFKAAPDWSWRVLEGPSRSWWF